MRIFFFFYSVEIRVGRRCFNSFFFLVESFYATVFNFEKKGRRKLPFSCDGIHSYVIKNGLLNFVASQKENFIEAAFSDPKMASSACEMTNRNEKQDVFYIRNGSTFKFVSYDEALEQ